MMTSCSKCTSNQSTSPSDILDFVDYNLLPRLDINSATTNIHHLTTSDIDLHMPSNQDIVDSFQSYDSFSAIHCNVRSLSANHDSLVNMLPELYFPFSLIGLSETKQQINKDPISNLQIPSYHFVSQPSHSNAGGVGFFIKDNLKYIKREDLSISDKYFEALWIEIQDDLQRNLLCGVIYRHPKGNLNLFFQYINSVLQKVNREGKYIV